MTLFDVKAILPIVILGIATAVLVVQMSVKRSHAVAVWLSLIGLAASFWSLFTIKPLIPYYLGSLLVIDAYSLLFSGVIIVVTAVVCVMMFTYLSRRHEHHEEMYPLLLIATIGSIVLTMSDHFVTLILGLETLTIPLYVMIGYLRDDPKSLEASVKYLVLAAASSAFLLLGMGLIYAEVGSMVFPVLTMKMTAGTGQRELFVLVGTALVIVGAGFKLGVVPFHMWTPDVYQGAPAPVTAYIATVSKTAMVALLLRYLTTLGYLEGGAIAYILAIIAVASMLAGNLLAIMQSNLKRLLAYSSIAHLGYLLVAVIVGGRTATEAIIFYVIAYSFTTVGAFGLIGYVSDGDGEAATIDNYRGLFWRRPAIATVLSVMILSLAGIPLTAGFIGKFVLLSAGASGNAWTLVIVLAVASTIGLYYYLRVVATMLSTAHESSEGANLQPIAGIGTAVLAIVTVVVLYLGVQPSAVMDVIHRMLSGLFPT